MIRRIPDNSSPVETGLLQIGQDRPGLFIRGDEADALARALQSVARRSNAQSYDMAPVMGLLRQLQSCNPNPRGRY